ncbi:MAG: 2-alkenal reductase, partial [Rubrivivax sp.]|nr:2-alkenal reductase [Rubrivivax sp.]
MMRRTWLVFSQAVTVAVALLFVLMTFKPEWLGGRQMVAGLPMPTLVQVAPAARPASGADANSAVVGALGFAVAARRASPAVVSVTATKMARRNPHADDPRFRFFFGDRAPGQGP